MISIMYPLMLWWKKYLGWYTIMGVHFITSGKSDLSIKETTSDLASRSMNGPIKATFLMTN